MPDHHLNGPSSLYRRKCCPGSARMERDIEEPEQSTDAAEGELMHQAVWNHDMRRVLNLNQRETLAVVDAALNFPVDEWRQERSIKLYDDNCPFSPDMLLFGTADAVGFLSDDMTHAIIPDFKFGYLEVEPPEENLQFASEAVAISQEFPSVTKVTGVLIQPRIKHEPSIYTYTQFDAILQNIKAIIARTEDPELVLLAGSHCTYCKAKTVCPAVVDAERSLERMSPADLVTVDNVADIYGKCTAVKKRMEQLKELIKECLRNTPGKRVPGLKLTTRQGNRQIVELQAAYNAVSPYVSMEEFLELCHISVSGLESLVAERMRDAGTAKTIKEGREIFAECIDVERADPSEVVKPTKSR